MTEGDRFWQTVPLTEFCLPAAPAKVEAEIKLSGLRRLFKLPAKPPEPVQKQQHLTRVNGEKLRRLAPAFNWQAAAKILDIQWSEWLRQQSPNSPVRFLVGPPFSGQDKILQNWATTQGWDILPIPNQPQLLDYPSSLFENFQKKPMNEGWVIPNLEHCFLRDANGLAFIRQLFEAIYSGLLGRCVIACDSWAWSYIQWIWPITAQQVFCMQGLTAENLARHYQFHIRQTGGKPIQIQNAKNGTDLLSNKDEECNSAFKRIATVARGNPGICWHYWRNSLYKAVDQDKTNSKEQPDKEIFWWLPPDNIPIIPTDSRENSGLLLHALLLHNGLSSNLLAKLLPLAPTQTLALLYQFEQLGIVRQYHEIWRVTPLAYSEIRHFLSKSGYQTDQF